MKRPSHTVIGVDIGRHTIKAAQLHRSGGEYRVSALWLLPRPQPDGAIGPAEVETLRAGLDRHGFHGRRLAVAAPERMLLRATLEVPARLAGPAAEQVVRMELARLQNLPPDSFELAYWDWKSPDNPRPMTAALAVGCPHAAADALLDLFEDGGFAVAALDVRGAALARACRPLLTPAPQISAIVDLGWRSTSVQFVCGRSLVYERSVSGAPIGELASKLSDVFAIGPGSAYQIIDTVGPGTEELGGPYDRESLEAIRKHVRVHFDRLLDELKAPLSYANRQFPGEGVKRLLLLGGGAGVPGLASYFEARLGLEVRRAAPGDLLDCPTELLAKAGNPAQTCAVGLAQFEGI
jgi:type IV pilus assembly protein PilM